MIKKKHPLCPKCGKKMFRVCNACGVFVRNCTCGNKFKDRSWGCPDCAYYITDEGIPYDW